MLSAESTQMYKIYFLVSFWLEATLYGLYFSLFVVALNIMMRKQALATSSSRVFLTGILAMFVLITFHNSTNMYRMLTAYASYDPNSPNHAVSFLLNLKNWDAYAFPIIMGCLTWIGDILVIYRCFVIWQRNYFVIILPVLLLLASIGATSVNYYWFHHEDSIPVNVMTRMFRIIYPLNLAQNILTTSFIGFRLYKQYKVASKTGFDPNPGRNFILITRIIVESALIYTTQMLILTVLCFIDHPSIVIIQHALAPSIGIVFVLIAIRAHAAASVTSSHSAGSHTINAIVPTWLTSKNEESPNMDPPPRSGRRSLGMRFVTTSVVEEHQLDDMPRKPEFVAYPEAPSRDSKVDEESYKPPFEDMGNMGITR